MTFPIPKEILIHSCILLRYAEDGVFGERQLISSDTLSNVRIELHSGSEYSVHGRRQRKCGTMYFDCRNSSPLNVSFMGEDFIAVIEFMGAQYEITGIKYIYGDRELHHLEIELGGNA